MTGQSNQVSQASEITQTVKPRSFQLQKSLDRLGHLLPWLLVALLFVMGLSGQENAGFLILIALISTWVYKGMVQGRVLSGLVDLSMRLDQLEAKLEQIGHDRLLDVTVDQKYQKELAWIEGRILHLMQRWPIRSDTRLRLHHRLTRVALLRGDFELVRMIVREIKQEDLSQTPVELPMAGAVRNMIQIKQQQQLEQQRELMRMDDSESMLKDMKLGEQLFPKPSQNADEGSQCRLYLPVSLASGKCPEAMLNNHLLFMWVEASMAVGDLAGAYFGLQELASKQPLELSMDERLRQLILQVRYESLCGQFHHSLAHLSSKLALCELLPSRWVGAYLNELAGAAHQINREDLAKWLGQKAALVGISQSD